MKTKTPKTRTTPKRGRGRPRKNGHAARKEVSVFLPTDLLAALDSYVKALRQDAPGASRGDVLSAALRAFWPFRGWRPTQRPKRRP